MKVKVGDKIYDEKFEPVMVILSPQDKLNIASLPEGATRYCAYPEGKHTDEEIKKWIREGDTSDGKARYTQIVPDSGNKGLEPGPVLPKTDNVTDGAAGD